MSVHTVRPPHRRCDTFELHVGETELFFSVGLTPRGLPMELFIDVSKEGSTVRALYGQIGRLVSHGWQHGVSVKACIDQWIDADFPPRGIGRDHPAIEGRECVSLLDAIARVLLAEYGARA